MKLRGRPVKLLALVTLVTLGTIAAVLAGLDLFDGEIALRRLGSVSPSATPIRFLVALAGLLAASGFLLLGWLAVRSEWNCDYRAREKPMFDDPDRRRAL